MSKPANKRLIGIFVLGAITLLVIAIVVLGSGDFFRQTFKAVCFFEGSVGGLNVGAPVVFKGVRIGSVRDLALRYDTQKLSLRIPVYIEIEPNKIQVEGPALQTFGKDLNTLIDRGLRASLEMQSIVTGQMQVGLDFFPDKPAKFVGVDTKYPEIPTVKTPIQELAKKIEKIPIEQIFDKLSSTLDAINKVAQSPEILDTIRSLHLAVADVRKLVQNVDSRFGPLASSVEGAVNDYGKLARNADNKIETLSSGLDDTIKKIQKAVSGIEKTLEEAQSTLAQAKQTLSEDSTLSYEITGTLEELQKGARSIRLLADDLKRHPESVIWGRGKSGGK
ncbi:MAG TPA: MlaD family protein [Thermodesulfobacteriota bacterium]|jgi:paraquat-inducible protein B|nr:MlaD family protein [Thermodesulfobacteriota bacterium]